MCGNFGLVALTSADAPQTGKDVTLKPAIQVLEAQTACTEVRGGQAGGISCLEFDDINSHESFNLRVRCVARKRFPLAADLAALFNKQAKRELRKKSVITFIGHTRFATSSVNKVRELHPHEWVKFHQEYVWSLNIRTRKFEKAYREVGIHITHNGDFDALYAYNQMIENGTVGLWLERVLHVENNLNGDSPKIAGCMDLFRVQGRWNAAARFAYLRAIARSVTDVSNGQQLSKSAPNSFPDEKYWENWGNYFDTIWQQHVYNVINVIDEFNDSVPPTYEISMKGEAQLINSLVHNIHRMPHSDGWSDGDKVAFVKIAVKGFLRADTFQSLSEFLARAEGSFGLQVHTTLEPGVMVIASKGQPMSVAFDPDYPICLTGSEGEAVAVPVDSNGRWLKYRIDLAYGEIVRIGPPNAFKERRKVVSDPMISVPTTASETSSTSDPAVVSDLIVPDPTTADLSDNGVLRRQPSNIETYDNPLLEISPKGITRRAGSMYDSPLEAFDLGRMMATTKVDKCVGTEDESDPNIWLLNSGIELYSYVLDNLTERQTLKNRIILITRPARPYDPTVDLVGEDIMAIPAVLSSIDRAWRNPDSPECLACTDLADCLIRCMQLRLSGKSSGSDLIVGAVEASLWVAEQFVVDLRAMLPELNVAAISTNKLLGFGGHSTEKLLEVVVPQKITEHTCVVFISQSGQTFPTLHATTKISNMVKDKMWIVTGCMNSKMEKAVRDTLRESGLPGSLPRVINNYSGNRPAEPTSVAIVSTIHTLTCMMLHIFTAAQSTNRESDVKVPLLLDRNCMRDVKMMRDSVIPNMIDIVGYDTLGVKSYLPRVDEHGVMQPTTNERLIEQGKKWAEHVSEPWMVLVLAGTYIIISVGIGLPLFGAIARIIIEIIKACGVKVSEGALSFSVFNPDVIRNQPAIWTILGVIIQFIDAVWFVYIGKMITWASRRYYGRPMWARHGKRTLVIVDSSCNHQLLEIFVSKLFSQSYSFVSLDVHGANGLDHFVHRFTHRVVRGVLLAVGRPDGRLCCLAKSEAAVLLSVKQAAFIQNPAYPSAGAGPDIVSIGHNPFKASMGLASQIALRSDTRPQFVDEYIYDRLHEATIPFTGAILRHLANSLTKRELETDSLDDDDSDFGEQEGKHIFGKHFVANVADRLEDVFLTFLNDSKAFLARLRDQLALEEAQEEGGPGGEEILGLPDTFQVTSPSKPRRFRPHKLARKARDQLNDSVHNLNESIHRGFSTVATGVARMARKQTSNMPQSTKSDNPFSRLAFSSRLDNITKEVQDSQLFLQQFYESRVASLERYVAFCVMFHALAKEVNKPWLCMGWDLARSQSNLRVATTASPVSAGEAHEEPMDFDMKKLAKSFASKVRKYEMQF